MAAVAIYPASGDITALVDACNITCSAVDSNTLTGYDADNYPSSPAIEGFFRLSATGQDDLVSPVFSTNAAGVAEWPSVIFPAAGSWTLDLVDTADDSVIATAAVTVA